MPGRENNYAKTLRHPFGKRGGVQRFRVTESRRRVNVERDIATRSIQVQSAQLSSCLAESHLSDRSAVALELFQPPGNQTKISNFTIIN